jgi:4-carboxymuconolactone decarboxylase
MSLGAIAVRAAVRAIVTGCCRERSSVVVRRQTGEQLSPGSPRANRRFTMSAFPKPMTVTDRARVAPLPEPDWDAEQRQLLEGAPPLTLLATLVRHPALLRSWLPFARAIQSAGVLPDRDRELLILRTAWNCRSDYEWGHHARLAVKAGLSEPEVARVADGPDAPGWEHFERALLRAADQLHARASVDQRTWETLAERYDERELIEVLATVGQYHAVAFASNALGVTLESGFPRLPLGRPDRGLFPDEPTLA